MSQWRFPAGEQITNYYHYYFHYFCHQIELFILLTTAHKRN